MSKTSGTVLALSDLDASIAPGDLIAVAGPSACGESTLFNIVAGL